MRERIQTDHEGEAMLLEPADELGLTKASISQEKGDGLAGQESGDEGAQPALKLVLTVTETLRVVDPEDQRQRPTAAGNRSEEHVELPHLGPVDRYGHEAGALAPWPMRPNHRRCRSEHPLHP